MKDLKFVIKSKNLLTEKSLEQVQNGIEKFKNGESEIIIFPEAISIAIFNENNELITLI